MTALSLVVRVDGVPGPKGSVRAFCRRCATRRLTQQITVQEESETGIRFRKVAANALKMGALGPAGNEVITGPVTTHLTFFIHRQKRVKAGVEIDEWIPSHQGEYPTSRNTGDVEKHVRTIHDALMDAGILADDSQVWRTQAEKRWATPLNPPGAIVEVWQ